ncbi:MAG: type II toxin-antitoxin system Phd/YefM family antitoxin [Armatimonadota bacterium]
MSIRKVSTKEATRSLSRLLRDVKEGGEVVITARGRPVAVLAPYESYRRQVVSRLLRNATRLQGLTLKDTYMPSRRELEDRGGRPRRS